MSDIPPERRIMARVRPSWIHRQSELIRRAALLDVANVLFHPLSSLFTPGVCPENSARRTLRSSFGGKDACSKATRETACAQTAPWR
jgi:hypothetical protein